MLSVQSWMRLNNIKTCDKNNNNFNHIDCNIIAFEVKNFYLNPPKEH